MKSNYATKYMWPIMNLCWLPITVYHVYNTELFIKLYKKNVIIFYYMYVRIICYHRLRKCSNKWVFIFLIVLLANPQLISSHKKTCFSFRKCSYIFEVRASQYRHLINCLDSLSLEEFGFWSERLAINSYSSCCTVLKSGKLSLLFSFTHGILCISLSSLYSLMHPWLNSSL